MARMKFGTYIGQDKDFKSICVGDKVQDAEGHIYTVTGYGSIIEETSKECKPQSKWKTRDYKLYEEQRQTTGEAPGKTETAAANGPTPEAFDNGIDMLKNENRRLQLLNGELAADNERLKSDIDRITVSRNEYREKVEQLIEENARLKEESTMHKAAYDELYKLYQKALEDKSDRAAAEGLKAPAAPLLDDVRIHPDYYRSYGMEVLVMMEKIWGREAVKTFCKLNAFKYRMRMGRKDDMGIDFGKEQFYLQYALNLEGGVAMNNQNENKIRWNSLNWTSTSETQIEK